MKPQPRYQPGDKIGGRYQVHKALMGGMGEVYLCIDLELRFPFALKTFQQKYFKNTQLPEVFKNEAITWIRLENHPNIVRCYYVEILDKQPFLFLEWITNDNRRGTDLRSWLQYRPLEIQQALEFTIDICHGLIHANRIQPGIVHRDLKPENILIEQGWLAKITDFGLAQVVQTTELVVNETANETNGQYSLICRRGIAGTPPYMAPEQWLREPLDVRTDIYAVGCILYELLTGYQPFQANTINALGRLHLNAQIPKVADGSTLPQSLDSLLDGCLAKRREDRFTGPAELLEYLTLFYQQQFNKLPRTNSSREFTIADYENRGITYINLKHYEEALAEFNRAIEIDPTYAKIYSSRGTAYMMLDEYDKALTDQKRAIELDPTLALAYINRGSIYHELKRNEKALSDYSDAIRLDPGLVKAYYNRGNLFSELGQNEAAIADFSAAIEWDPSFTMAYYNRGNVYDKLQRYNEAIADYTQATKLDPTHTLAFINRGAIYENLHRDQEALADYNHAVKIDPNSALAYYNRGVIYAKCQHYEKALREYNEAIRIDSNFTEAYFSRGITCNKMGRYTDAIANFSQTIQLAPDHLEAYYNRGLSYSLLEHYQDALTDFAYVIKLDATYTKAHFNRGFIFSEIQKHDAALAEFSLAIQHDPLFADAYIKRGDIYVELRENSDALKDYNQAIKIEPTNALAYFKCGQIYQESQQYEQALTNYEQAIHHDPNYATTYLNIGSVLGNQGRLQEALSYFEKAAQLGEPQAEQHITQARKTLQLAKDDPTQQAMIVFAQANSLEDMRNTTKQFPFMKDAEFISLAKNAVIQQIPAQYHKPYLQRLSWLRQVADEGKSSGFLKKLFKRDQ